MCVSLMTEVRKQFILLDNEKYTKVTFGSNNLCIKEIYGLTF